LNITRDIANPLEREETVVDFGQCYMARNYVYLPCLFDGALVTSNEDESSHREK
jgi:hypothetical protein